jgi:hypothetical protein
MKLPFVHRINHSIRQIGIIATLRHIAGVPLRRFQTWKNRRLQTRLSQSEDPKVIFEIIHQLNIWDDAESVSGPGSTLAYTENLRSRLPLLFDQLAIRRLFDAPCGDFNWMGEVVRASSIQYRGGDIVPALVKNNQARFGSTRVNFQGFDIILDRFPDADLWLCRDCLFHLTYQQIYAALKNFTESSIPYALLTNHRDAGAASNHDISTGDCRGLDLMAAPFQLPADIICRIQEGVAPTTNHEMCLWTREQILDSLPRFKAALDVKATRN